jgi:glutathione S-transferase
MRILYGSPISPFARKVAVMLEEKGLDYEVRPVRPHDRDAEFRRLSPLGKIPAYKDDAVGLADSSVICVYLEKTFPEVALYPAELMELLRALWFEEYFDGAMFAVMGVIYVEQFMNPCLRATPTNQALLEEMLKVKLPPMLAYLESQLQDEWLVGGKFSIADISIGTGFVNMRSIGIAPDKALYPKLAAYVERVLARPSFVKCAAAMDAFVGTIARTD